jgi:hypothetical protein
MRMIQRDLAASCNVMCSSLPQNGNHHTRKDVASASIRCMTSLGRHGRSNAYDLERTRGRDVVKGIALPM